MTPLLALSGPDDLTIADIIAGSAFWVGLIVGGFALVFRYRAAAIAAGVIELCIVLYMLFFRASPEESIFALIATLAFFFLLRREKK